MAEADERQWKVLINDEEQYALFPASLTTPGGWTESGYTGSEEACMKYVDERWTDMRPRSLREAMQS